MSRFLGRARGWVALALVLALLLPVGRWAADEFAFGTSGAAVEEELGDEAFLAEALLLVRSVGCDGRVSTGSAFALEIDGDEVIVTNRHVVDDARGVSVRRLSGGPLVAVERVRTASLADVAVLELADPRAAPPALPAGDGVHDGAQVRVVGFPAGRPATETGSVTSVTDERVLIDARVIGGVSGSPVLDAEGRVVAQVFATAADGAGVATPVDRVVRAVAGASDAEPC